MSTDDFYRTFSSNSTAKWPLQKAHRERKYANAEKYLFTTYLRVNSRFPKSKSPFLDILPSTCSGTQPLWISGTGLYGLDVLPVTRPTLSNHWRRLKALTPTNGLASTLFIHHHQFSLASSPAPVKWMWKKYVIQINLTGNKKNIECKCYRYVFGWKPAVC